MTLTEKQVRDIRKILLKIDEGAPLRTRNATRQIRAILNKQERYDIAGKKGVLEEVHSS